MHLEIKGNGNFDVFIKLQGIVSYNIYRCQVIFMLQLCDHRQNYSRILTYEKNKTSLNLYDS